MTGTSSYYEKTRMTQEHQQMLYGDDIYPQSDVPRGWPDQPHGQLTQRVSDLELSSALRGLKI